MLRLIVFFLLVLVLVALAIPTNGLNPRKLDDITDNKCGGCPCNNPCNPPVPSPPPPTPSPPPPALPPPSPPPPPKKPPTSYCPPPPNGGSGGGGYVPSGPNTPNSQYIYITGPPGNLYPVDQYYSGAENGFSNGFSVLVGGVFLGLLAFW